MYDSESTVDGRLLMWQFNSGLSESCNCAGNHSSQISIGQVLFVFLFGGHLSESGVASRTSFLFHTSIFLCYCYGYHTVTSCIALYDNQGKIFWILDPVAIRIVHILHSMMLHSRVVSKLDNSWEHTDGLPDVKS